MEKEFKEYTEIEIEEDGSATFGAHNIKKYNAFYKEPIMDIGSLECIDEHTSALLKPTPLFIPKEPCVNKPMVQEKTGTHNLRFK